LITKIHLNRANCFEADLNRNRLDTHVVCTKPHEIDWKEYSSEEKLNVKKKEKESRNYKVKLSCRKSNITHGYHQIYQRFQQMKQHHEIMKVQRLCNRNCS
jgi:hypothetical protein